MAMGIASSIVGIIAPYLKNPILNEFRYLFCYNDIIKNLGVQLEVLKNMRFGVGQLVEAAERNIEVIQPDVADWLKEVDEIKLQAETIINDEVDSGCFNWLGPNLKCRYSLSRKASKTIEIVVELQGKGNKYTKLSYPAPPVGVMASTSTEGSKGFESRMLLTEDIIEVLKKDEISMIGICGMGGVGKTTMANEVVARAKVKNLFQEVAMVVVSQNQDLMKIQDHLASKLGLKFVKGTDIEARAERLHRRLTNGNKILVILDDVWDELDLKKVGIPVGGDRKGCKVVLTSRIGTVCSDMGTQHTFTVLVLPEQEAWDLFKANAGNSVDAVDVHPIAKELVRECGGLPIAIVTVGKALKNRKKHAWEDALRQFRKSALTNIRGMHKNVYTSIELSYNCVESIQARSLLLLCCLFPEDFDIPVEHLVRYGVGLELFKDEKILAATRDRVCSLIDELKSCSLLLGGDQDSVKMHDVVRDVCLSIASKKGYVVKHDIEVKEWPQNDTHEPYTAISLRSNQVHGLPDGFDFTRLKLLQVIGSLKSPEKLRDFFPEMKELRVAAFSDLSVETPLLSLQLSTNIRTLCLHSCYLRNTDISIVIGRLKDLEILSFFRSELDELPKELGQLSNLKSLDLRCRDGPRILPPGVLSNLCGLEELYTGRNYWAEEGYDWNASITELNSLSHLNTLEIYVSDVELLPKDIGKDKLKRFNIKAGGKHYASERTQFQVSLTFIEGDMTALLQTTIKSLVRRTENLDLTKVKGFRNIVKLDEEGFVKLKNLDMYLCQEVECLIDAKDLVPSTSAFGSLEEVRVSWLPAMRHLWRGPIQPPYLSNLRVLRMICCDSIESLFPRCAVKCFVQLQDVDIQSCKRLKEIFSSEGGEDNEKEIEKFPKLRKLFLNYLPRLRRSDILLFNQQVLFPSMEELHLYYLGKLLTVVASELIKQLHNLKNVGVSDCNSLETVFDFEGLKVRAEHVEVVLSRVESLGLYSLPKLTHICRMILKGVQAFQNLGSLRVERCRSLRYLLTSRMAQQLVKLQELVVDTCKKMERVIETEKEEPTEMILFPQVKSIRLDNLPSLKTFVSGSLTPSPKWPVLNILRMRNCPKLKTFHSATPSTQNVEAANIRINETSQVAFSSLEELHISSNVNLDVIGHGQLPNSSLCKLRNLEIRLGKECDEVPLNVVISNFLPRLRNLEILSIERCTSLVELFEFEDGHREITPEFQPKGMRVQDGILVFKNLRELSVKNCSNLRNLLPCSVARRLLQLQKLEIRSCKLMEEIVTKQGGEERMDTIVFPQLTHLEICGAKNLTSFFSGNYDFEFPSLRNVFITFCPKMKTFSFGLVSSPKLKDIVFGHWALMMNDLNSTIQHIFEERMSAAAEEGGGEEEEEEEEAEEEEEEEEAEEEEEEEEEDEEEEEEEEEAAAAAELLCRKSAAAGEEEEEEEETWDVGFTRLGKRKRDGL